MRVLLVAPEHFHEDEGRRARRVRELVSGLIKADHTAEVATVKWWDQRTVTHHDRWTTHHAVGRDRLSAPRLARRVRNFDPDVVHLVDVPPSGVIASSVVTDAPVIYEATELGGELAQTKLHRPVEGAIDRIIVPSEVVATELLAAGIDVPIDTIPDPIRMQRVRSVTPADSATVVWHARSLEAANLEDLLLALAETPRSLQAVLFLDEGTDAARQAAAPYDLDGTLDIRPHATLRERLAVYRGAAIYIHTADRCAFATELLRALAAGCVGLVSLQPNSSAHELVSMNDRGIRVGTPEELVGGIERARTLEQSTMEPDFADYDVAAIIDRLVAIYEQAISQTA